MGLSSPNILRTIYNLELTPQLWTKRLFDHISEYLPRLEQSFAFTYSLDEHQIHTPYQYYSPEGVPESTFYGMLDTLNVQMPMLRRSMFQRTQCDHLELLFGGFNQTKLFKQIQDTHHIKDVTAIAAGNMHHDGFIFGAFEKGNWSLTQAQKHQWHQVAHHIAASIRVRDRMDQNSWPDVVDAVFDPRKSTLVHARQGAQKDAKFLGHMAQKINKLHTTKGRAEDDLDFLAQWEAVTKGQWLFLEVFDSDGTRFIVALENHVASPFLLSKRQQKILKLIMQGHSQTFIAHELDLKPNTIATHLQKIRTHFKARSDAQLVDLLSSWMQGTHHQVSIENKSFAITQTAALTLDRLSPTERELVRYIQQGRSDLEIAQQRQKSPKTIRNQLHHMYKKLHVHSRSELLQALASP